MSEAVFPVVAVNKVLVGRERAEGGRGQVEVVVVVVAVVAVVVVLLLDDGVGRRRVRVQIARRRVKRGSAGSAVRGFIVENEAVARDVAVGTGGNGEVFDGVLEDGEALVPPRLVEAEAHDGKDEDDEEGGEAVHHPLRHVVPRAHARAGGTFLLFLVAYLLVARLRAFTPRAGAGGGGSLRPALPPVAGAFLVLGDVELLRGRHARELALLAVGGAVLHAPAPGARADGVGPRRLTLSPRADAVSLGVAQGAADTAAVVRVFFGDFQRSRDVVLLDAGTGAVEEALTPGATARRGGAVRQALAPLAFTAWRSDVEVLADFPEIDDDVRWKRSVVVKQRLSRYKMRRGVSGGNLEREGQPHTQRQSQGQAPPAQHVQGHCPKGHSEMSRGWRLNATSVSRSCRAAVTLVSAPANPRGFRCVQKEEEESKAQFQAQASHHATLEGGRSSIGPRLGQSQSQQSGFTPPHLMHSERVCCRGGLGECRVFEPLSEEGYQ